MQVAYWTYKLDIAGPVHLLFDHMESWTNLWRISCFFFNYYSKYNFVPRAFLRDLPFSGEKP